MPITNYQEFQQFMNGTLQANGELEDTKNGAPHGDWWNSLTYEQFIGGDVPNVLDPSTNAPMPTLVVGDDTHSNFVMALQGTPGSVFDPNTGSIGRMPADGPPYFTPDQIEEVAAWIRAGCPNGRSQADTGKA